MTLQDYKEKKGFSYRDLAVELGVGHDLLFRYIKGERFPSMNTIVKIEESTNGEVSVNDWLKQRKARNKTKSGK